MRHLKLVVNNEVNTRTLGHTVKLIKDIKDYLENECCFRDYEIVPAEDYGTINEIGQHILIEHGDDIEYILNDALDVFTRDGYPCIYVYV